MAYRYLFIADLYEERNRETFLWEAVPERCLKWFPFIVLKWRKISEEISFLWKNRKYTWSDVQRLAITHSKYYLICENVHELSFLKTFWCCGLFKKNYQNSGWRWSGEGHMIEIDPATFLLPVAFHLHGQMFEQPGLCQQCSDTFLGSLDLRQCWDDTPTPGAEHCWMVLVPAWPAYILFMFWQEIQFTVKPLGRTGKAFSSFSSFSSILLPLLGPVLYNLVPMNTFIYISIFL